MRERTHEVRQFRPYLVPGCHTETAAAATLLLSHKRDRGRKELPDSCFADVAQTVELRIRNAKVPGPNPGVGSTQAVLAQRQCACLPRRRREFDSLVPLHDDALVQSVRMPACHAGGRGSESRTHRAVHHGSPCGGRYPRCRTVI